MTPAPNPASDALAAAEARAERAEQAAAEALRDKRAFLEAVEHAFRQSMAGVVATADLLGRHALSAESAALVRALQSSAASAQQLFDDALALSHTVEDAASSSTEAFRPSELLDAVETLAAAMAAERHVRLVLSHEGDPELRLIGDARQLTRALTAIVENAIERSGGRVVEVSLSASETEGGGMVLARVRDGGDAVPQEALARLFEPGGHHGCGGLRMALARRLIQSANGAVWAESNAGSGLTLGFDVALPLAEPEAEADVLPGQDLGAPRVLIVDDNATNRLVATAFCEMAGCLCEGAEDGLEALTAVKARSFDLILMDIRMPRMDGVAATRAIRGLSGRERDVPILALTADADPDAVRGYLAAGMADVVEKPIKPEVLLTAIQKALTATKADDVRRSVAA